MPYVATPVILSETVQTILTEIARSRVLPTNQVQRANIILLASKGLSNKAIAEEMRISPNAVSKWRMRYVKQREHLHEVELHASKDLYKTVVKLLKDAPRSGRPATFTQEEIVKIYDVACKKPKEFGIERSHWSTKALTDYVSKEIKPISVSQVWHFLDRAQIKPFRSRYWLNSKEKA